MVDLCKPQYKTMMKLSARNVLSLLGVCTIAVLALSGLSCYKELPELAFPSIRIVDLDQNGRESVEIRSEIIGDRDAIDEIGIRWGVVDTSTKCDQPLMNI